jgi:hypothetical protein
LQPTAASSYFTTFVKRIVNCVLNKNIGFYCDVDESCCATKCASF